METLKKRSEFLRIRGGARWATAAFVLEARRRPALLKPDAIAAGVARFGFTVTKKLGPAVIRNRIRRRLKAAVAEVAPRSARADCDYVLVARQSAAVLTYARLLVDLEQAFSRVNRTIETGGRQERGKHAKAR